VSIRVVVVDDEPLGRRGIVSRLKRRSDVAVVAQCANGRDAIAVIRSETPDLLFLDVQMPGVDGFELLRQLVPGERPHIIFVTAFDRHALRAFDEHALDYLLKPIDDERFNDAVERAIDRIRRDRDSEVGRRVAGVVAEAGEGVPTSRRPSVERYPIRSKGRVTFVRHVDIDWVEAEGDYVRIHAGRNSWLVRDSMRKVESALGSRRFLRIHRSAIVAVDRVQELRSLETGDYAVVLRDGTELRTGRSYRSAVERLASGR
jgi:two-component system LytT family response regulator